MKYYTAALSVFVLVSCGKKDAQQAGMQAPPAVNVTLEEVKTMDAVYHDQYPLRLQRLIRWSFVHR